MVVDETFARLFAWAHDPVEREAMRDAPRLFPALGPPVVGQHDMGIILPPPIDYRIAVKTP